jgi:NitT/TauT family transport system ATP-binding protein
VLLMDEPFAALDAMTRDEMQKQLTEVWQETRKTIIYITHNVSEAVYLADELSSWRPIPAPSGREFAWTFRGPAIR